MERRLGKAEVAGSNPAGGSVVRCDVCGKDAVIFIRYNGRHLCERHFSSFLERRVKRDVREQIRLDEGIIAVGVSGGKDSNVLLYLLHKIFGKWKNVDLYAITVDEGIKGYREKTIKAAETLSKKLGVEHIIIRLKEIIGITVDEVANVDKEYKPCSYCGVWRRKALNIAAKEIGAKYIALGTNLDDYSQTILMNFVRGDIAKLAKLAPHTDRVIEGMIPRVVPLRFIPEKETTLYAIINNIPYEDAVCPYAQYALRNDYRKIVAGLESRSPGTRHSIVRSYLTIRPKLYEIYPPAKLNPCRICGEPTSGEICKSCQLIERYKKLREKKS